jgi:hypothetical protein
LGKVRLPAPSKSRYVLERPSGPPGFYRAEIIQGLQREVLRDDVARYALEEFKRQLQARLQGTRSHLAALRARREKLKTEITQLGRAIADGHSSAALLSALVKREQELDKISEDLLAADGRGFDAKLQEIEAFVQKRLQDIRGLLFADVPRAKAELSKHCTAITLTPEGSTFCISGDWNLLGRTFGWCRGPCLYRSPISVQAIAGGVRAPARTERLPVRFGWLAAA